METKQKWEIIWQQMTRRNETTVDIQIAQAFYNSGWKVYPESGYRFQKKRNNEDGYYITGITQKEARELVNQITKKN